VAFGGLITTPTAPTRTGYTFNGWYTASSGSTLWNFASDTMPAAALTLYAQWTVNNYTITFNSNGGSAVAPITQAYGSVVTAPADPTKTGNTFAGWYSDAGLTTPYTFTTMPASNITLYAKWTALPATCYALTLNHTGQGSNPVASPANSIGCPAGQYVAGASINLSGATPDTGWQISSWTGTNNNTSTASTNTATMPASAHSASVNYTQGQYTLTITSANGSVARNPNQATYAYGQVVQLTATPYPGWSFTNWTGNATGTANPVSVTMNGNKAVTANYTQNHYTLTVKIVGCYGSVIKSPNQTSYHYGDTVTLTAIPSTGWTFSAWSGGLTGSVNPATLTIQGNTTVTATFTQAQYKLTVTKTGTGSGTVSSSPAGINCGATCSANFNYNTSVTLTAAPATGSTFTGWSGACSGTGTCKVTMTSVKSVSANFNVLPANRAPYFLEGTTGAMTLTSCGAASAKLHAVDPDGDNLTWQIITNPRYGMVTITGTGNERTFTYWSWYGYRQSDSFVVKISDGRGGTATFTFSVIYH
jgi:uncharacterized repeat protein (TIGR02543 family)